MRYLGIIVILIGVVILGLYYFNVMTGNGTLMTAGTLMVLGLIGHIILNKIYYEE
jgi:hypothetical protein